MLRRLGCAIGLVLLVVLAAPSTAESAAAPSPDGEPVELVLFYGAGCPHCHAEIEFLTGLQERWPDLQIAAYEVWGDEANRTHFEQVAEAHGVEARGVPGTFVGGRAWIGYSPSIGVEIEEVVAALLSGAEPPEPSSPTVDVPFVGAVDVGDRSLVASTFLIAFVDGVNPCSLWVLAMLLAVVLHSGSRGRVFAVGSLFLVITAALYGLYMVGAYTALDYAGDAAWIRLGVAAVAGVFGLIHLKQYVTDRGPSLSISDDRKPTLYRRMRALARPDRSLPAVLGGTASLAVGVSLLETPCTAGLPLLWTDLLAERDVPASGAVLLFLLYLAVFLADELILFGTAVLTLRAVRLQEVHGRVLQLVSGTLMVTLAATMLLAPRQLESLSGTLTVFGGAALAIVAVLLAERLWSRRHEAGGQRQRLA